jgi:hypothetical protein
MSFDWLSWSNQVAIWWGFLLLVSVLNIVVLLLLHTRLRRRMLNSPRRALRIEPLFLLCAAYVF